MAQSAAVLLLDDGELDDVQEILEELGVEFGRVRGGAIVGGTPLPSRLLVTTPRRIEALSEAEDDDAIEDLVRIVVVHEDSNTLRDRVREIGFDFLVRRPVHPEALRLLLMHSLYQGEERRREPRIPVGFEVSFRTGMLPRKATLVDLSTRGCRLLSPYALEPGKRIKVQIPESLGATESLSLGGRVLRMKFDERLGTEGLYSAAIMFEELSTDVRNELEWIIEDKVQGPPTLQSADGKAGEWLDQGPEVDVERSDTRAQRSRRGGLRETVSPNYKPDPRSEGVARPAAPLASAAAPATAASRDARADTALDSSSRPQSQSQPQQPEPRPAATAEEALEVPAAAVIIDDAEDEPDFEERRSTARRAWDAKVPAFGTRALRVLVGRDLSMGGMRIAPNEDVELGDRLHLAIYGRAGDDPLLVWGTVTRNDGDAGIGVIFDQVHPLIGAQLEKLVTSLPPVESLHDDEIGAMGTVLTEILED